jgi:phospholipid N-methyltransferase
MGEPSGIIWSNTDYPYLCLVDRKRTLAFRRAIDAVVRPGDTVVEVGAGTGILSLFAAAAGAAKVYAVEIDHVLARSLRETVLANDLADVIEVVEADALTADLPPDVDVVIGELIETGLLDEMQVAVMNGLRARGVIGARTRLVPESYQTCLQLAATDNSYFGFAIHAPKHEWPYYSSDPEEWEHLRIRPVSEVATVSDVDFSAGPVDPVVDTTLRFRVAEGATANAIILSGSAGLTTAMRLGACNSFSGDKVLPLPDCRGEVELRVRYEMGQGLDNLAIAVIQVTR